MEYCEVPMKSFDCTLRPGFTRSCHHSFAWCDYFRPLALADSELCELELVQSVAD